MRTLTSTWVARHWAATADAAAREPIIVTNHQRKRVVVLDEQLAEQFLTWYATQDRDPDPIATAASELERHNRDRDDTRAVRELQAKITRRRPARMTDAHLELILGLMPDDREAFEAIKAEYADDVLPWPLEEWRRLPD